MHTCADPMQLSDAREKQLPFDRSHPAEDSAQQFTCCQLLALIAAAAPDPSSSRAGE